MMFPSQSIFLMVISLYHLHSPPVCAALREPINTSLIPSNELPRNLKGVGVQQKLGAQVPLNLTFTDELNHPFRISELVRGDKPVVLTLAYFKCPSLCTLVLNGLVQGMREMNPLLGRDFRIITLSINPKEASTLALGKKRSYLSRYSRLPVSDLEESWKFLTGKEENIRKLAEAIGFSYNYDALTGEYSHPSVILVLTPKGKISQYLFGMSFPGTQLELALKKASRSEIGSTLTQLLLYCFHYDPNTGQRSIRVLNILKIFAGLTLFGIAFIIRRYLRLERSP